MSNLKTFINIKNFENFFLDFQSFTFPKYAQQIFKEVGWALKDDNNSILMRSLNENIFYAVRDEKSDKHNKNDYLVQYFNQETSDWKISHARTLYLADIVEDFNRNYAQITMKFSTSNNTENYIVFERNLGKNLSFYSWKIFIINYGYFL